MRLRSYAFCFRDDVPTYGDFLAHVDGDMSPKTPEDSVLFKLHAKCPQGELG